MKGCSQGITNHGTKLIVIYFRHFKKGSNRLPLVFVFQSALSFYRFVIIRFLLNCLCKKFLCIKNQCSFTPYYTSVALTTKVINTVCINTHTHILVTCMFFLLVISFPMAFEDISVSCHNITCVIPSISSDHAGLFTVTKKSHLCISNFNQRQHRICLL